MSKRVAATDHWSFTQTFGGFVFLQVTISRVGVDYEVCVCVLTVMCVTVRSVHV